MPGVYLDVDIVVVDLGTIRSAAHQAVRVGVGSPIQRHRRHDSHTAQQRPSIQSLSPALKQQLEAAGAASDRLASVRSKFKARDGPMVTLNNGQSF